MSKARFDRKPPLAKSPIRLRSRAVLRSNSATLRSLQTPPGSLTKSKRVTRQWDTEAIDLGPDCYSMSCELRSLTRMVSEESKKAESAKRKDSKKLESARKSVCSAYSSVERNETPAPRYLPRSSTKENKKPPPGSVIGDSAVCSERRVGVRGQRNTETGGNGQLQKGISGLIR